MEKDFCFGIILGMIGGALLCANSYKVRKTVKDGQDQVINALNKMNENKKSDQPIQE